MAGDTLAPTTTLTVEDNGRLRASSNADTTASNPFLTPAGTTAANSCASSVNGLEDSETALRPDPGTEADFQVENNVFAFSPGQLNKLLNPKSLPLSKH